MKSFSAAPQWVVDLCQAPKHAKAADRNPKTELDTEPAIKRAIDYLRGPAPKAIAFEGGNDTTYRVAARVREIGISEGTAFDLMAEHWNEAGKAEPPWDADDLKTIIENAYSYATAAWGGMSGLAEFEPVDILERPKKERRGLYRVTYEQASAGAFEQIGTPLVEDLITMAAMIVVYGASGSGKTFLMLDIAFHIAAGIPWNGHKTEQGVVLYVAAEGGRGIFKRIAALKQHYGLDSVPLDIVPCPINLLSSKADIKALLALIEEAEAAHGRKVVMVVVDTLSRALAGGEENASTDMGAFVQNMDRIRDGTGATVAIVHHSGKDAARGARGHSLLRAATDTEIEIGDGTVRVTKQRDLDPITDMRFKLETLTLGKTEDGKPVRSCVVRILKKNEFVKHELTAREESAWKAFIECLPTAVGGVVRASIWDAKMTEDLCLGETKLRELRVQLVETGWVKEVKKGQYVSTEPVQSSQSSNEGLENP